MEFSALELPCMSLFLTDVIAILRTVPFLIFVLLIIHIACITMTPSPHASTHVRMGSLGTHTFVL